jgi:AcrR family transcriptional regulator
MVNSIAVYDREKARRASPCSTSGPPRAATLKPPAASRLLLEVRGSGSRVSLRDMDFPASASRRPRDRRSQIATKASELFSERGYQSVRMDDIAEAAEITARAIYRHYDNKQALLSHILLGEQSPLIDVVEELSKDPPSAHTVDEGLTKLIEVCLDNRRLSLLWQREARHLSPKDFNLVRNRTKMLAGRYNELFVRRECGDLETDAEQLRGWAVASISSSCAYFDLKIPRAELVRELVDATDRAILAATALEAPETHSPVARHLPRSRREQLIAAAAHAFRRSGYAGVSIDVIGREVGVVGPALYRYFENKADILVAAITRFSEWRALETLRALEETSQEDEVIFALIDGYAKLATEFPDLVAICLTERLFLPTEVRDRFDRVQAENLAEWQRWLLEARPDLDPQRAAVLSNIAKTVIDDSVRNSRLRSSARFKVELRSVVHAALGIVSSTASQRLAVPSLR